MAIPTFEITPAASTLIPAGFKLLKFNPVPFPKILPTNILIKEITLDYWLQYNQHRVFVKPHEPYYKHCSTPGGG